MIPEGCVERCRGCLHRGWSRDRSESQKRDWLAGRLASASADTRALGPPRGVEGPARWGYRDKVCLRAEWSEPVRRWKLGLTIGTWREREVLDLPRCPLHSERVRRAQGILAEGLPGPERNFPLVFVRLTGALATLVLKARDVRDTELEDLRRLEPALRDAGIHGLFLNLHPSAGNRVVSPRGWRHVWGDRVARDEGGFLHGPESFRQLIAPLHEEALSEARAFLEPGPGCLVVDLYSGSGESISLWQAAGARSVGVELGADAVECATQNAGPDTVLRGRASERLPQLDERIAREPGLRRLLFTNPPRAGMEKEVTRWVAASCRPERIAYLSCSAGTLARDLSVLLESGYALRRVTPYDFFPQTHHVEALALLHREA